MRNKDIISIIKKAKSVKPYARVDFPYSVFDCERILGVTFTDEERSEIQRFYDTANLFSNFVNKDYGYNPLYYVITGMISEDDFVSIKEFETIKQSILKSTSNDAEIQDILFVFTSIFSYKEAFVYANNKEYLFEFDMPKIRRKMNLDLLIDGEYSLLEFIPKYVW
jgi:hypothetical protein